MAQTKTVDVHAKPKSDKKFFIFAIIAFIATVLFVAYVAFASVPKIIGKYRISAFINNGKENTEMLELINAYGGKYTIEFRKDKTGLLTMGMGDEPETAEFVYTDKEIYHKDDEKHENPITYEYKDDAVTITLDGMGMKFSREN